MGTMAIYVGCVSPDGNAGRSLIRALRECGANVWDGKAATRPMPLDARTKHEARSRLVYIPLLSAKALRSPHLAGVTRIITDASATQLTRITLPVALEALEPDSIWPTLTDLPLMTATDDLATQIIHVLRLDGSLPDADASVAELIAAGNAYFHQECHARARDLFQRALAVAPDNLSAQYGSATAAYCAHDYAAASDGFKRVIALAPELPSAWRLLAQAQWQMGRDREAEAHLIRALEIAPDDLDSLAFAANFTASLQQVEQTRKFVAQMQTIDPEYAPSYSIQTDIAKTHEERTAALATLKAIAPDDAGTYQRLIRAEVAHQRPKDALATLDAGIPYVATLPHAADTLTQLHLLRAQTLFGARKAKDARTILADIERGRQNDFWLWFAIMRVYWLARRYRRAKAAARHAIQLAPENASAWEMLATIESRSQLPFAGLAAHYRSLRLRHARRVEYFRWWYGLFYRVMVYVLFLGLLALLGAQVWGVGW